MEPLSRFKEALLSVTVFFAGAVVLILEILGAKLLAPFFGATLFVWSSLIAVTLFALALGYHLGGRLADRVEPLPMLNRALILAGWLVLLVPPARIHVLPLAADLGLRVGALAAAQILLAPALTLLGSVAPLAAKTAVSGLATLGLRVGTLYALSTLGSLAGALAAGFLLIPTLGSTRILMLSSLLLFVPALVYWLSSGRTRERVWWGALALVGCALAFTGAMQKPSYPIKHKDGLWTLLDKTEGGYGEVKVVQYGPNRILLLSGSLQTSMDMITRMPLFSYATAMQVLIKTAHPQARNALLVGFGGGIVAERLAKQGIAVDSVEIDPEVIRAARRYFVSDPGLPVIQGDARTHLASLEPGSYDIIIMDAYTAEAPPSHLLTVEAYRLVRRALTTRGVGIANIISPATGPHNLLARCVYRTLKAEFPWVEAYAIAMKDTPTNILYVFADSPRKLSPMASVKAHPRVAEELRGFPERRLDFSDAGGLILTDDYNPAETMIVESLEHMRRHLRELFPPWILLG